VVDYLTVDLINVKMTSEMKFLDAIQESRDVLASSPLGHKTYIYGPIPVFWEVFMELDESLNLLLGIAVLIQFIIVLLFMEGDIVTALITSISCGMIVVHTYGIVCSFMNFNVFVATFVLMAMGMSVEFTCHLAAAFSTGRNSCEGDSLGEAMGHVFPALFEGIVSTFFGVLPLAFHPTPFVVKYVFGIVSLVVLIGTINGMLFMPAMLAVLEKIFITIGIWKEREITEKPNVEDLYKDEDAAEAGNKVDCENPVLLEDKPEAKAEKGDETTK